MIPFTVDIQDFRSIAGTRLVLQPGTNILIGSNGSGKTNLFAALKFLRDLIRHGAGLALAKSGGPVRNYRRGATSIRFVISDNYGERIFNRRKVSFRYRWEVVIAQSGPESIASVVKERFLIAPQQGRKVTPVFDVTIDRTNYSRPRAVVYLATAETVGRDIFSTFEYAAKEKKPDLLGRVSTKFGERVEHHKRQHDRVILPEIITLDNMLRNSVMRIVDLNEYNILPDVARQATDQLPIVELSPNGGGLSEIIHALENRNYHRLLNTRELESSSVVLSPYFLFSDQRHYYGYSSLDLYSRRVRNLRGASTFKAFEGLLERINEELSLAVRSVDSVSTQVDPTNGKRFVVFKSGDHTFYPEEVSDGTIKWLSILVSIFVPFSSTYLLEEPENFLHPWMQQQLVRIMREQAKVNGTLFLVTTHSATVMNASLPAEITVISRNEEGTTTSRLADKSEIRDLLDSTDFGLGDLWVSGLLGGVPEEGAVAS